MGEIGSGPHGRGELSDDEAERLLNVFRAAGGDPAATSDRQSDVAGGGRHRGPGPAAVPGVGNSAVAGTPPRMTYSAGWDGAENATDGAHAPAQVAGPAAPTGVWRPDGQPGSGDNGGGTTVSSVDFLADLGPSADVRAVAKVLSAAAAPPWPHELRGYESARRAFEKAGGAGSTPIRHTYSSPLRRLVGVKLAVAGALTVTGVAVAAEADVLPSPIQRAAHQMLGGVGVPEPDQSSRGGQPMASPSDSSPGHPQTPDSASSDRPSGQASSGDGLLPGTPTGTTDAPGQTSSTSVSTDVLTLCRTYVAHQNGNGTGDTGLTDHDQRLLAALAGGADKIDGYCAQVLGTVTATGGGPTPQPSDGSTNAPVTPNPSHDHKPGSTSSDSPNLNPATSPSGAGNGHTHTPDPTRTGH